MLPPPGWKNPIVAPIGQTQQGVDPLQLLPSRVDLLQSGLDKQAALRAAGIPRSTPIMVTVEGVIWDGHHAVRLAAEEARTVDVRVVRLLTPAVAPSIMALLVR